MTITRKQILLGGAGLFGLGAGLLCLSVLSGGITVAGTDEHLAPVRFILRTTMERSVRAHAREVQVPPNVNLNDRELAQKGYGHYSVACTPCHGAPGQKPAPWMVINPAAPLLVETANNWSDAELFWITKHGIKMTGMPALGPTHKDEHLWAISALVRQLPTMTPEEYLAMGKRYEAAKQTAGAANHSQHGM